MQEAHTAIASTGEFIAESTNHSRLELASSKKLKFIGHYISFTCGSVALILRPLGSVLVYEGLILFKHVAGVVLKTRRATFIGDVL